MTPERTRLLLNVLSVEEVLALLDLKQDKGSLSPQVTPPQTIEPGLFGAGTDGGVVFDGTSTVLGIVPSGGIYTLIRSIFPSSMIVQAGVTVRAAGYRIFVSGTLTNDGTVSHAGNNGANATEPKLGLGRSCRRRRGGRRRQRRRNQRSRDHRCRRQWHRRHRRNQLRRRRRRDRW